MRAAFQPTGARQYKDAERETSRTTVPCVTYSQLHVAPVLRRNIATAVHHYSGMF
jgi:hypothetical protein